MACPLKFGRAKKPSKIFRDFWQLSTLIVNISESNPQIENRKSSWSTTTPPTLDEKKTVNFGPQTKKVLTCILTNPSGHFSGDYISALRGCCALKIFIRARDWPRLPSAHPNWDWGSPKKFWAENLKFGLKFSVWASITSGLVGISSPKFSRRRDEFWSTCEKVIEVHIDSPKWTFFGTQYFGP